MIPFLSEEQLAFMAGKVFDLLEKRGVKMEHAQVVDLLAAAGAVVDADGHAVRFPRDLVERSLAQLPKRFRLAARGVGDGLEIPRSDGTFQVRTTNGGHGWIDHESGAYRKATLKDIADWAKLADGLDEIGFSGYAFPNDAPTETADIHGFMTLLANSAKHVWIHPYSDESIEYLMELATVAAGGEDALRRDPPVSIIACAFTPLNFKHLDLEVMRQAATRGMPIHACSLLAAGGTAPITMPGLVILGVAEILVQVVVAQAVAPSTPVIANLQVYALDMRTGRSLQSSVEAMQGAAAAVQLMKRSFGLPSHTYGPASDSMAIDGQSMIERALQGLLVGLSDADILGGAGQLETVATLSPVQLVIDNELVGMVRQLISGLEIDDETVAWDELMAAEPGSHFLTTRHTLRHCRDGYDPEIFSRLPRGAWQDQGSPDLVARATETCRGILARERPAPLSDEAYGEMAAIVAAADRHLRQ